MTGFTKSSRNDNDKKKLAELADKIEQMMKDNDVCGAVVVHSAGFSETRLCAESSFSAAQIHVGEGEIVSVSIKGKLSNDRSAERIANTANFFLHLKHFAEVVGEASQKVLDKMSEYMQIRHTNESDNQDEQK